MPRIRVYPESVVHDLWYAARQLRRAPGFALAVAVTLGLGIGANATMFGVIDRLLLRPPEHVRDSHEVHRILVHRFLLGAMRTMPIGTYPDYRDFDASESFAETAAYASPSTRTLGRGGGAQRVQVLPATASLFPLLGVNPALGRFYTEDEDRVGRTPLAVLNYGFWQRQFGGDPDVLTQQLQVGDIEYAIVGVAPKGFTGAELHPIDVWVNLMSEPGGWPTTRDWSFLMGIARLKPTVSVATAEAEATALHRARREEAVAVEDPNATIVLAPLIAARGPHPSAESVVTRWLTGVSLIVLLIACANVANLMLARGIQRRREIAVRLALGVSRRRLIAQLLTESLALAVLGGATGLFIAWWGAELMRSVLLPDIAWPELPVSGRVLFFSAGATIITGLLAGIVPAIQSTRPDLTTALKAGERGGATRSRTRAALTVAQGALSLVLLVGAGLLVRSLVSVRTADLGFEPGGLLVAGFEFENAGPYPDSETPLRLEVYRLAEDELRSLPQVAGVTSTNSLPFWSRRGTVLRVPGRDSIPTGRQGGPYINAVSPSHFSTMQMTLIRGRAFTPRDDRPDAEPVTVVTEKMARVLWPDEDPLGQCMLIGRDVETCSHVVGVVKDLRDSDFRGNPALHYFVPRNHAASRSPPNNILIRIRGADEATHVETVRRTLQALHPAIRYVNVRPMQDLIEPRLHSWRLGATMFTVFGALALLLAGIGMYSVLAFNVAQRTHELGVRMALGAKVGHLFQLVFTQAGGLLVGGTALGLVIALALGPTIEPVLFNTSARDPAVFATVLGVLAAVGVLAAFLPAWRAATVDLNRALRAD